jgi:hypothetical protein
MVIARRDALFASRTVTKAGPAPGSVHAKATGRRRAGRFFKLPNLAMITVVFFYLCRESDASHYRFGNVAWKLTSQTAGGYTVEFQIMQGWRWGSIGTTTLGAQSSNLGSWYFGDGSQTNLQITLTAVNQEEAWVIGSTVLTYTYTTVGPHIAYWESCCRVGSSVLSNNGGLAMRLGTTVDLSGSNTASPVSNGLPIVTVYAGQLNTWQLAALDADGDALTYVETTAAEYIGPGKSDQPAKNLNGVSVALTASGQISFQANTDGFYSYAVSISDGQARIMIDFMVQVTDPPPSTWAGCSSGSTSCGKACASGDTPPSDCLTGQCGVNPAPRFDADTLLRAGQPTCFPPGVQSTLRLSALDDDCDTVTVTGGGLPLGASVSRNVAHSSNGVGVYDFVWSPTV